MQLSEQLFHLHDSEGNREFFIHRDGVQSYTSPWILSEHALALEKAIEMLQEQLRSALYPGE